MASTLGRSVALAFSLSRCSLPGKTQAQLFPLVKPGGVIDGRLRTNIGKVSTLDGAVAAFKALPASGMGNTVTARGPKPRLRSRRNSAHCWKCSALV
jgi:hypothetical protein